MEPNPAIKQITSMKIFNFQPNEKPQGIFAFTEIPINPNKQQQKINYMKTRDTLSAQTAYSDLTLHTAAYKVGKGITNAFRIYTIKKLISKTWVFAIALLIASLFGGNTALAQTSTLFLKNTATNAGANATANPNVYDLSATQGTPVNITTTTGANSTTFVEILAFTITNSQLTAAINSDQFNVSLSVQSTQSNNMTYRYRLQRVNSSGAVQASTGYSGTVNGFTGGGPVVTTATLSFGTAQTWASTDRLRLSIEDNNTSSSTTRTMTINTNNANSFVRYCSTPTAQNVTGGGSYCTGGTAVAIGLSNSQTTVNYQLYRGATPVGSAVAGTGAAISFVSQTTAGTYTVTATSTVGGCTANMTGSAIVTVNSPVTPSVNLAVAPGNSIPDGSDAIFTATASNTGGGTVIYNFRVNGSSVQNTASNTFNTSSLTSGNTVSCDISVSGGTCLTANTATSNTITMTVNPLPMASVTGQSNLSCFASADGTITILASGGSGSGYEFSLNNGSTYISGANPYTFTGLSAGVQYRVRVKDSNASQSPAIP